mgnify:FL=1
MDPFYNPFAPSAGQRPPELAGRTKLIEESVLALRRALAGRNFRSIMYLGLRGTGKTVLLNEVGKKAKELGFLVSRLEAPEDASLAKLLYPEMKKVMRSLSTMERTKELSLRTLGILRNFASIFKIEVAGVDIGIEPTPGVADTGYLETDLPDLFENIGEAAQTAGKGWAIFLDEVQYLTQQDLSALIVSMHRISQLGYPVIFVGAGLPLLAGLAGQAKSYAERLFRFYDVGALDPKSTAEAIEKPLNDADVQILPDALTKFVKGTQGYPFYLQQWASCTWDVAPCSPITITDVSNASAEATRILDEGFFRVRLNRMTKSELEYCSAMASLGEKGPYRTSEIAQVLGKKLSTLGALRSSLIAKGMIYSPTRGNVDFTVPLFATFLLRFKQHHLESD